jgi:hypothetical protein
VLILAGLPSRCWLFRADIGRLYYEAYALFQVEDFLDFPEAVFKLPELLFTYPCIALRQLSLEILDKTALDQTG